MLHILWGLLGAVLAVSFAIIYVKAIKLVKDKMGILAAIVFTMGFISYLVLSKGDSNNKDSYDNRAKTWTFNHSDSLLPNSTTYVDTVFEKTWISDYAINVEFAKDKQGKYVAVSASTFDEGITMGTSWKPAEIVVKPTEDNKQFVYYIDGTIQWKLLGVTLYSQEKQWKVIVLAK